MTLRDLIDVSETPLLISEDGYSFPFLNVRELDCNTANEFSDEFSEDFLNRKVDSLKVEHDIICVNLEVRSHAENKTD